MKRRKREYIVVGLILLSLVVTVLSPKDQIVNNLINQWEILLVLLASTEALFILGILIMAAVLGYDLGPNVFKWRKELRQVMKEIPTQRAFWVGFWINAVGAFGTGLVVLFGVLTVLPAQAWGLSLIAVLDIAVTLSLRYEILQLSKPAPTKNNHN